MIKLKTFLFTHDKNTHTELSHPEKFYELSTWESWNVLLKIMCKGVCFICLNELKCLVTSRLCVVKTWKFRYSRPWSRQVWCTADVGCSAAEIQMFCHCAGWTLSACELAFLCSKPGEKQASTLFVCYLRTNKQSNHAGILVLKTKRWLKQTETSHRVNKISQPGSVSVIRFSSSSSCSAVKLSRRCGTAGRESRRSSPGRPFVVGFGLDSPRSDFSSSSNSSRSSST